jgi:phosphoglycerate dehydrogenase-like enzyme
MFQPQALPDLLPRADFVLVTAPDTANTHHMIGAREIALLKPGAGIVNYSRAGLGSARCSMSSTRSRSRAHRRSGVPRI